MDLQQNNTGVRPETRALKRSVAAALARQKRRFHGTEPVAVLVLQPNNSKLPSGLIEDANLEPVDKVIWLALMINAYRNGGVTVLPTHAELAYSVSLTARQTVSRSLAILRCRRWLTVCDTSWRKGGMRKGSAYALHAAPLPIVDTIYLDPRYPTFLQNLADQKRSRVQKAASAVIRQICHKRH